MSVDRAGCPRCSAPLPDRAGEVPWCAACEWNLSAFDRRTVRPEWGNRILDRVAHRIAFRLDAVGFNRLVGRPLSRRGGPGRAAVLVLAALVVSLAPASLVGGVYLMFEGPGATPYLGLLLVLFVVAVRPRFARGRADGLWVVTRETAPTLFGVLDRAAAATGAPVPDVVGFTAEVNASAGRWGRRRVLRLGLPLWAALPAQQRVALIAHELGHFVNRDVRSNRLVASARRTLATLVGAVKTALSRTLGLLALPLTLPLDAAYALLLVLGQRDGQRAEYLADQLAVAVAGSAASAGLLDFLLVSGELLPSLMKVRGRSARPEDWRAAGEQALRAGDLDRLRQRSLRTQASLLATHPPVGRRVRMVLARPDQAPAVTMSSAEAERADAELAPCYAKLRARAAEVAYT